MTERKVTGTRFAQATQDSAYVIRGGNARIPSARSATRTAGKNARLYIVLVDGVCFPAEKMFSRARVLAVGECFMKLLL